MKLKVNPGLIIGLIFLLGACGGEQKPDSTATTETAKQGFMPDTMDADTTSRSLECPCENLARYNVANLLEAYNYPIKNEANCESMLFTPPDSIRGFWFSKTTLDLMFCHKDDANGIFVYEGRDASGQKIFIAEAGRTEHIVTLDDGVSHIYYSRGMCPTICGVCAD